MTAATVAAVLAGHRVRPQGGNFLVCCPVHDDRNPSLSLRDGDTGLLVHCFAGCDPLAVLAEIRARIGSDFDQVRPSSTRPGRADAAERARKIESAGRIWRASVSPRGTLAERYLNGRDIDLPDDLCDRVLRFHPACPWKDSAVPALIAAFHPITEPDDDALPVAIMRVGLNADGGKIAKGMMLGSVAGCAIKLDAGDNHGLGIAEGLETALKVRACGWRPVWALGSAGGIETFAPLVGIEALTIFADNDESGTGIAAARACAERWADAELETFIRTPRTTGADWADVPRSRTHQRRTSTRTAPSSMSSRASPRSPPRRSAGAIPPIFRPASGSMAVTTPASS